MGFEKLVLWYIFGLSVLKGAKTRDKEARKKNGFGFVLLV
jgi:hypothetical protein